MEPVIFQNDEAGREAFGALASKAVQWIRDYYANIHSFPVRSQSQPGEIYNAFPDEPPQQPVSDEAVFKILNEVILPGITHWQHPNFYAFFPGNTSFPSIAAEIITAGIAAQCMLWESSPAAAELEQRCMDWCRDLLGLPSSWQGVIQDTASTATLSALLTAREWKSGYRISKRGFDGTVYRIYASAQAHSSIEKAVRLAGFGTDNLVLIPVDENLSAIPERLEALINDDLKKGFVPTCVVSTIGTTGTGAIDPIEAISTITNQYGLWHHVDAAYLGTALMLDEYAHLRAGIEGADSFVFNPHKWMFVQFDCTSYFVKDVELLTRTMSINPSYLQTVHGDKVRDYRDWGVPLGRRFRALKLWMTFQLLGTDAIQSRLRHHIALACDVEKKIEAHEQLELAYPRSVNIVSFRIRKDLDPDGQLTKQWARVINDSGKAYITYTSVEGRSMLRWVPAQTYTQQHHIDSTWDYVCHSLTAILTE
ncbi:MAG: aminotransferase class V-fold PLP-dependent enzyme [Bacteroidota bacterium]|nr:aminotransferase class V-fold PLP-dependent enzyme [Bacteroidota bacterium]